ncbi:bifunctional phosphopantothenoylcysteine decarboxylase/phosphopantothenate--cysteine ligase CoaBC [Cyclobacterium sp. 1_MG-2023]|uniref:bifunctional phosphopantothenoylcysteine decarboxylase/phosphopantothenate--cysteine ligase CoaBC n=1 Tax=Cyclobacterium sp. 1_MG-2023 TaxID=3062681 RepID=UPI0026E1656E|nr:bifunctional phosphopantothenoylcysteine decarboxylase/phosphopantothenate--cysteine ligase CoaBC [Cyclobacterium sp. 1_MG-2023]MDO6439951.1 bifunctional phosphopantothenoylcysteine decarboxylase/phosphopantothenate--cysteine ligase CoaBC [Cyclobacterium sp. 1_MG-2023]
MPLSGKRILLGVTGGIAAYKAAQLVRLLVKSRAEVKVVMTASARDFITPLTLATLSKNPVSIDFFNQETGEWTNHVALGAWADILVIAPLSANTLSKLANGQSDSLLSCTYLSCTSPVLLAPAMDLDMYQHPSVKQNLATLEGYGNHIMEATSGELASGLIGQGRMPEPEAIFASIHDILNPKLSFQGKTILITAGPTQEAIDPVRYISNHSSGKMGIALTEKAAEKGAKVTLILGPTALKPKPHPNITIVRVTSALDMFKASQKYHSEAQVVIFCAAVADYRIEKPSEEKIKKKESALQISLIKNPDIAKTLGAHKKQGQLHIGFALETDEGLRSAENKLKEKNFDFVVLNSLLDSGAGFQKDTNQVTILSKNNERIKTPVLSKEMLAIQLLDQIASLLENKFDNTDV